MTEVIAYLEAVVGADITSFRRGMQDVRRDLNILSDTAGGLQNLGRSLTLAVTTPLVAAGFASLSLASDFDAAMRNVNSIAGLTEDEFRALSAATLEFGSSIRSGPEAAANALYTVVSAGITDIGDAMDISQIAAKTAEAGLADLEVTTEALVAAMLSYGAGVDEASRYSDILTRTVQIGVGTMTEFGNAFAYVLPASAALGISFEEVGANMAYLTQRGFATSTAATSLNNAFKSLLKPTEALQLIYADLGVDSGPELIQTMGGIEGAIKAISEATGGDIVKLREVFADERGFRAVAALLNDADTWSDTLNEFNSAIDGATDRAQAEQMKSFAAQMDLLKSAVSGLGIVIGQALLPVITPLINWLTGLAGSLSELPPEVVQLTVMFGGLVAAIGPLLWILGSLLNPIGLLVAGVATLSAAFITNMGGIRDSVMGMIEEVLPGFQQFMENLGMALNIDTSGITDSVDDARTQIGGTLSSINVQQPVTFTILPGQTPGEVAAALGITVEELLAATNSKSVYELNVGTFTIGGTVDNTSFMAALGTAVSGLDFVLTTMINEQIKPSKLKPAFDAAATEVGTVLQQSLIEKISGAMEGTALEGVFDGMVDALTAIGEKLQPLIDSITSGTSTAFDTISGAVERFVNDTDFSGFEKVADVLGQVIGLLALSIGPVLAGAAAGLSIAIDAISRFISNFSTVTNNLGSMSISDTIGVVLKAITDALISLAAIPVTAIAGVIDEIMRLFGGEETNFTGGVEKLVSAFQNLITVVLPMLSVAINDFLIIPINKAQLEISKAWDNLLNQGNVSEGTILWEGRIENAVLERNVQAAGANIVLGLQNAINAETIPISPTFNVQNLDGTNTTMSLEQVVALDLLNPASIATAEQQLKQLLDQAVQNNNAEQFTAALDIMADLEIPIDDLVVQYQDFIREAALAPYLASVGIDVTLYVNALDDTSVRLAIANAMIDMANLGMSSEFANASGYSHDAPNTPNGQSPTPYASGGTVAPGQFSQWNERGMELFMPGEYGQVLPTRLLRDALRGGNGGQSMIGNVNIYTNDPDKLIAELRRRGIRLQ